MKRLVLIVGFLLLPIVGNCAELLVRASSHWMDALKPSEVNKFSTSELQSYNARTQIGDIIVVRPDGWEWGKEECLPTFIVVKIPGITVEAVKLYEQSLMDTNDPQHPILLKVRKYKAPDAYMSNAIVAGQSVITINLSEQKTAFINSIVEKTQ